MRIALVYDCIYPFTLGGVEHRNHEMARRLRDRHDVTLFGYAFWKGNRAACLEGVNYCSIGNAWPVHGPDGKRRILDSLRAAVGTFRALLSTKCEVWDIANIAVLPVIAAAIAARLRRRRLVVTWFEFFGPAWNEYLGPRLGPLAARLERLALRCSPVVLVGSPLTRDRLLAAGYPPQRLHYIPNGINTAMITATPADASAATDLVTAGRLTPHKRVHLAIEALAVVRRTHPGATLGIIGDGPERPRLEHLARELGLADAVTFHGFVASDADVFATLKAGRVAVFPSAREGFGLAAVQSWCCGLPVVTCGDRDNATAGLVTDDRLGRVVPADSKSLANAVLQNWDAASDAEWRIAHAREHYDLDVMLERTLRAYAGV